MRISFPGRAYAPVDVPDACLLGVYGPAALRSRGSVAEQLAVSLARPLGSEPLEARLRPGMRVLVIVGDRTSLDPTALLLPPLLDAVQRAGVAAKDLEILVATASRRVMTPEELRQKLGAGIEARYPVSQHRWSSWAELRSLGDTPDGFPVVVNSKIAEADFVIAVHDVVPDRVGGYTGGSAAIAPGCLGDTHSTLDVRWQAALYPATEILGIASNPIRRIIDEIARIAGLDFVVQVVLDGRGEVVDVVSGDPFAAYQASVTTALQIYGVDVPAPADVVIADAGSADWDLFQAAKGLYAARLATRPGGAIILVAGCPEGVAPTHSQALRQCVQTVSRIDRDLSLGIFTDIVAGAFLAMVSRAIETPGSCYLVSQHLSQEEGACVGLSLSPSPGEALDRARTVVGSRPSVLVLRQATVVVPRF